MYLLVHSTSKNINNEYGSNMATGNFTFIVQLSSFSLLLVLGLKFANENCQDILRG